LVGIPLIHDQEENAIKVVASGSGLQLSKYSSTLVQEVHHSTNQILTDKSFKSNAERISNILRHAGMTQH
jgi:UDP:flavonoid glycosyltransferase YjiC (YdhE family)